MTKLRDKIFQKSTGGLQLRKTDVLDFAALRRICEVCREVHFHDEKPGEEMGFFGMKLDQRGTEGKGI